MHPWCWLLVETAIVRPWFWASFDLVSSLSRDPCKGVPHLVFIISLLYRTMDTRVYTRFFLTLIIRLILMMLLVIVVLVELNEQFPPLKMLLSHRPYWQLVRAGSPLPPVGGWKTQALIQPRTYHSLSIYTKPSLTAYMPIEVGFWSPYDYFYYPFITY